MNSAGLSSRFCLRDEATAHAQQSISHGRPTELVSAAGLDDDVSAEWWEWFAAGLATMVIPSSSVCGFVNPHIGSGSGSGTFSAAMPDSQCPAVLPMQQAIVLVAEATAIGNNSARNDVAIVIAMSRLAIVRPVGTICL